MKRKFVLIYMVLCLSLAGSSAAQSMASEAHLWQALKNGSTFALLRHALAPGTGDPGNFNVRDCATQRLLSAEGRSQAINIGNHFRDNDIQTAKIYSSQWCRCLETAKLLNLGPVEELTILNSFYGRFENKDKQTSALKSWLADKPRSRPLVLVTHQVNITAFTGIFPRSGEMVIIEKKDQNNFSVIGTIVFE